jgi:hypothetical protein
MREGGDYNYAYYRTGAREKPELFTEVERVVADGKLQIC